MTKEFPLIVTWSPKSVIEIVALSWCTPYQRGQVPVGVHQVAAVVVDAVAVGLRHARRRRCGCRPAAGVDPEAAAQVLHQTRRCSAITLVLLNVPRQSAPGRTVRQTHGTARLSPWPGSRSPPWRPPAPPAAVSARKEGLRRLCHGRVVTRRLRRSSNRWGFSANVRRADWRAAVAGLPMWNWGRLWKCSGCGEITAARWDCSGARAAVPGSACRLSRPGAQRRHRGHRHGRRDNGQRALRCAGRYWRAALAVVAVAPAAEARRRKAAVRRNVSRRAAPPSQVWYSRYRVISHSCRGPESSNPGSGRDRHVQA